MICCCVDSKNLCEDYSCEVQKNDNGVTISLTTDKKEKVDALHQMISAGKTLCCDNDKSNKESGNCC